MVKISIHLLSYTDSNNN